MTPLQIVRHDRDPHCWPPQGSSGLQMGPLGNNLDKITGRPRNLECRPVESTPVPYVQFFGDFLTGRDEISTTGRDSVDCTVSHMHVSLDLMACSIHLLRRSRTIAMVGCAYTVINRNTARFIVRNCEILPIGTPSPMFAAEMEKSPRGQRL